MPTKLLLLSLVAFTAMPLIAQTESNVESALLPIRYDTTKPWTRWWWLGSAVSKEGLTAQLEKLAEAGVGGVEVTPIYGIQGREDLDIPFLSEQWLEMLEHAAREARRLGMGLDMATCTGWPFGGPWVAAEDASQRASLVEGRIVGAPVNMQVKRAAPGGEGLVVDPFSTEALGRYLQPFEALERIEPGLIRSQFHDSFEYYNASWTPQLEERFRQRFGYDLQEHAALLLARDPSDPELAGRVKGDFRALVHQLHLEYIEAWGAWSRQRGYLIRNQAHGAPGNLLDLYAAADIPETEIFGSTAFPIPGLRRDPNAVRHDQALPEPLINRMASSAAHVMGRRLTSSESCTWLRDHWKEALAHAKPELDRVMLDGINHIFFHGTAYSPEDAAWPGWLFYASTQFNPQNPWWRDFGALNAYLQRVQTELQSGEPDNDVLLYWPIHDIWSEPRGLLRQLTVHSVEWVLKTPFGRLAEAFDRGGYRFDYISDAQLQQTVNRAGELQTPGNRYRALVVPASERMPLETLSRALELARGGATVAFEALPQDVPGWAHLEERRAAMRAQLAELKLEPVPGAAGLQRAALGSGEVLVGDPTAALVRRGIQREGFSAAGLDFIRRRHPDGHSYFVANQRAERFDGWVSLGVSAAAAILTDPLDGRSGAAAVVHPSGEARLRLQLEPGQSLLIRSFSAANYAASVQPWNYLQAVGDPVAIEGTWSVEFFSGGPVLPEPYQAKALVSWTERGGEAARFAGTARYRIEFDLPMNAVADEWMLDLGEVRESARVRLNGYDLGVIWSVPFTARAGAFLRPGRNQLEIEVTNLAANRIRDLDIRGVNWKIMREINFVDIRYKPFDASQWAIEPSGLIGPVRLLPMRVGL
jgi:hypothetical protein